VTNHDPAVNETRFLRKASSGTTPPGPAPTSLPTELLREASRRLGWAGLVYSCTFSIAYFVPQLYAALTGQTHHYGVLRNALALTAIALGVAVFVLSRQARIRAQALLDLGLVFSVFGSLGIAVAEFSNGFLAAPRVQGDYLGVPWECLWIVMFPFMAPNTPRKVLVASIASASMGPLTLLVVATIGGRPMYATPGAIAIYFLCTTYVSALLAYFMAAIIMRYGVRLKKAREVGSYELIEPIGAGGMGEVWVARHRMLARPAAVKLIHAGVLGADRRGRERACKRFEREAQATAALGSCHTVDVFDFGVTDEGTFFYVMELLEGVNLDTLVKRHGPVEAARAVYLLTQMCHSLGEAHDRGLIHRDVKPANVFACRLGPDYDFVKVLDFGLVKHHADLADATALTADGPMAGTPAYMAPEMALTQADIDPRADIYAAGCVAYWLLTGQQVFEGETPMATLLKHIREEPIPPSKRTANPIPPALEAIVMACLAKMPEARPQTAAELSERLLAIELPKPWTAACAREWWQAHPADRTTAA
jgi:serine/threonine-protein kinase